ncbi:MAG: hypothetical protein IPL46_26865 [Saprospiraceae bacterium]|nr:hypothetical protein [Saprospiraceae bacterium]
MAEVLKIDPTLRKAAEILGEARKGMGLKDFPFESNLSMRPLVNRWMQDFEGRDDRLKVLYDQIKKYSEDYPSILDAYTDILAS